MHPYKNIVLENKTLEEERQHTFVLNASTKKGQKHALRKGGNAKEKHIQQFIFLGCHE